jgi:hypothetical protein
LTPSASIAPWEAAFADAARLTPTKPDIEPKIACRSFSVEVR